MSVSAWLAECLSQKNLTIILKKYGADFNNILNY